MTRWKLLGKYLGRPVKIAESSELELSQITDLESSVLLLIIAVVMPPALARASMRSLIGQQPLAILVSGSGARAVFDVLIDELGDGVLRRHVMTSLSEDEDIQAGFTALLQSTWPSEDRFDEWKDYAIINIGGNAKKIEQAVKKLCD
jgi:hypothetical protein